MKRVVPANTGIATIMDRGTCGCR